MRGIHASYLLLPLAIALMSGCAPMGAKPGWIEVTSEPAGAEVYVMGGKVGVTPLSLDQNLAFPLTYPSEKQALYGAVELRKAGCTPATQRIGTRALAKGLQIKLECGAAAAPAATAGPYQAAQPGQTPPVSSAASVAAPVQPPAPPLAAPAVPQKPDMASRLRQVQELRDKGLITEQELQEVRKRLLGEI